MGGPVALKIGTALCGWAFGSCFPLLVLTIAEMFGNSRFSSNYMIFDGSPGAVGAIVFAKYVAHAFYNSHAGSDGKCHGDQCFIPSHLALAGLQVISILGGSLLSFRVRGVYEA